MRVNQHIEEYLSYYLNSSFPPGFAILLKGKWGCGKTWFIKSYLDERSKTSIDSRIIYVTLYGISSLGEIGEQIFQQLHPVLGSKQMAFAGRVLRGMLKLGLNFDIDGDKANDGAINMQVPDISIPEYLSNRNEYILVIDDLERVTMPIGVVLGYINSFVENQNLRVIIVADEDKITSQIDGAEKFTENYGNIKEKLIGATFQVEPDIDRAFDYFASRIDGNSAADFIKDSKQKIIDIFLTSNHNNLRHLQHGIWNFARFFSYIPVKYININDLMIELLSYFLAFSFEIRSNTISPDLITELSSISAKVAFSETSGSSDNIDDRGNIFYKYHFFNAFDMLIPDVLWKKFFSNGYIEREELDESLSKSKYCEDQNTPTWVKLWHYTDLSDHEFEILIQDVTERWKNREYKIPGEVLHICGILIKLTNLGLINKSPDCIISSCKDYICDLTNSGLLKEYLKGDRRLKWIDPDHWNGLGYMGRDSTEFGQIFEYLREKLDEAEATGYPEASERLLKILTEDAELFCRMIYLNNSKDAIYYDVPIFKYVDAKLFCEKLIATPNRYARKIFYAFEYRYDNPQYYRKLVAEVQFLRECSQCIAPVLTKNSGKLSCYILGELKNKIDAALGKLETAANSL